MFKIKVCGITTASDARLAVSLGADMIGMITYKGSPRYVPQKKIREIISVIPPTVDKVMVAVGEDIKTHLRHAHRLGFEYVQWHGLLTKTDVRSARMLGVRIIFAVSNPTQHKLKQAMNFGASLVLLDNADSGRPGGTGKTFDWSIKLPAKMDNIMLAGGISADNVAEGVRRFRPLVVDVNSGVENSPGKKSRVKLKRFFDICNVICYGTKE